jgi:hypothetical protein
VEIGFPYFLVVYENQDSSVKRLGAWRTTGVRFKTGRGILLSAVTPRSTSGTLGNVASFLRGKGSVNPLLLFSAKVKSAWSYPFTPLGRVHDVVVKHLEENSFI